ncbi:MAG: hypothetical protein ACPGR2_02935 [Psychrobium sp.]
MAKHRLVKRNKARRPSGKIDLLDRNLLTYAVLPCVLIVLLAWFGVLR